MRLFNRTHSLAISRTLGEFYISLRHLGELAPKTNYGHDLSDDQNGQENK